PTIRRIGLVISCLLTIFSLNQALTYLSFVTCTGNEIKQQKSYSIGSVVDPDPDPHGSAFNLAPGSGSGSAFGMRIRIRIQGGKNWLKTQRNWHFTSEILI
ncbi:MAG: hypothetical protein AN484_28160, partial [Aphanizomenon flos-aquae WA102]